MAPEVADLQHFRMPQWARTGAITLAAAGLTLQLAQQAAAGRSYLAVLVVAGLGGVALLKAPRTAVTGLLVLSCTLWLSPRWPLGLGGVRTDVVEILAVGLMGAWLLWRVAQSPSVQTPYRAGLLLLAIAVPAEAAFALAHTGVRPQVIANVKTFGLYFLVLPFCAFFRTEEQKRLLGRIVVRVATVTSVAVLLAVAFGVQLEGRPGTAVDVTDLAQTTRIRPAVLPLLFLATMIVLARSSVHGATPARVLQLAIFASVWAVSYNRSSWVSLLLAGVLLLVIRPGARRTTRTLATGLAMVAAVPLVAALAYAGAIGAVPQTVATRASTLFNDEAVSSNSLTDRSREYDDAFRAISRQPVFGVGVGGLYGARRPYYDEGLGVIRYQDRLFSHNSWVYLYLQLGLLGLAAFAGLSIAVIRNATAALRRPDNDAALTAVAAACALVGAGIEAAFNPNLLLRPSIVAFALCLALVVQPGRPDVSRSATSRISPGAQEPRRQIALASSRRADRNSTT